MKKVPLLALALSLALSMGALVACSTTSSSSASSAQASSQATASAASQSASSAAATRTITDMAGNAVEIPATVKSVGTSWPGFINTICVAGGAQYITETPKALSTYPWATKIFPNLEQASVVFAKEASVEKIAEEKPDVLFLRKQDDIEKISALGIPIVMVEYKNNSIYDMVDAVKMVGDVLGGDCVAQAQKYSEFVSKGVADIKAVTDTIPESERPSVLQLSVKEGTYSTWGRNIIQDEEIQMAGGTNAAANDVDGSKEVTTEQILTWNPDYIFLEGTVQDREAFMSDPVFADLKAVQGKNVYTTPKGVFGWCRLGSETALYVIWMAQTLYPDQLASLDVESQAKSFYKAFFNYDLSDDDLARIMNAEDPA